MVKGAIVPKLRFNNPFMDEVLNLENEKEG